MRWVMMAVRLWRGVQRAIFALWKVQRKRTAPPAPPPRPLRGMGVQTWQQQVGHNSGVGCNDNEDTAPRVLWATSW